MIRSHSFDACQFGITQFHASPDVSESGALLLVEQAIGEENS